VSTSVALYEPASVPSPQEKAMSVTHPHARLQLAEHVRACEIEGQVILLDLKANRYTGVGRPTSLDLARRVSRWPATPADSAHGPCLLRAPEATQCADATSNPVTARLLAKGLLTVDSSAPGSVDASWPAVVDPTASLDLGDVGDRATVGVRRLGNFVNSAIRAAWWLRFHSLHSIVSTVRRHKEGQSGYSREALEHMVRHAIIYERLRPILLTAHEKCLFDSLALISFLAADGLFPHWVIGVKTAPFGAHSWVQAGATVLNDQHEYVRAFTPILVV